jgi:hypothetical protein
MRLPISGNNPFLSFRKNVKNIRFVTEADIFYGDKAKIRLFLGKSHLLCDRINDRFSWYGKRPTEYFSYF